MLQPALSRTIKAIEAERNHPRDRDCQAPAVCLGKETNNKGHREGTPRTEEMGRIELTLPWHTHHKARGKGKPGKDVENTE